jgi:hypothetical protein
MNHFDASRRLHLEQEFLELQREISNLVERRDTHPIHWRLMRLLTGKLRECAAELARLEARA